MAPAIPTDRDLRLDLFRGLALWFILLPLFRAVGLPYNVVFDQLNVWLPRVHLECDFYHAGA